MSTNEDIDYGEITEALNDKLDRDGRNVDTTSGADIVVEYQRPTSENNYTWYRLYKSGWIEQGGKVTLTTSVNAYTNITINLIKNMADTNYVIGLPTTTDRGNVHNSNWVYNNGTATTTSFETRTYSASASTFYGYWEVKGMSAQS